MLKVECYTSSKLNERPVAFSLSNSRYKVEEIIDRWYGEGSRYFKIKADDDNIYLLSTMSARIVGSGFFIKTLKCWVPCPIPILVRFKVLDERLKIWTISIL